MNARIHQKYPMGTQETNCDTHGNFCLILGNMAILTNSSTLIAKIISAKLNSCVKVEFGAFHYDAGGLREREPLLTSRKYCHEIIADSFYQSNGTTNDNEMLTMPHTEPQGDNFLSSIHVALKYRRDLMDTPVHQGFDDSEETAIALCQTACTRAYF